MLINIWQMEMNEKTRAYIFEGYEKYKKRSGKSGMMPEDYSLVFTGDIGAKDLDDVFMIFNTKCVEGFIGHSLSVSDLVEVVDGEDKGLWYCDLFGWVKTHWSNADE